MKLFHHGAHQGVTGSCHQLSWDDGRHSLLVDCGIFQGDEAQKHGGPEIEFPLDGIQSLLLTHVHIDHCGRLPHLMAAGFEQPIYCSPPSAKLLPLVMEDAIRIGFTRSERLIDRFLEAVDALVRPLDYHQWHRIEGGVEIRLRPAGHVLGSTIFEVRLPDGSLVVFSGDLGAGTNPLLNPPTSPPEADLLVLESTYGDRLHPRSGDRQAALESILRKTLQDHGVTIIPAFSLGRTQALLYEMNGIFERLQSEGGQSLLHRVDVLIDSPLASRFTALYDDLQDYWSEEAQHLMKTDDQPLVFENLVKIGDHDEHQDTLNYIARTELPAVVIAGSGMCTGGRVVNYLKRFLDDPRTDIVFCGYQASGTPGQRLQRGAHWLRLDGKKYHVAADVHQLSGYSAHADQADLIEFVDHFESAPKRIRLVHGDYQPKRTLAKKLTEKGYQVDDF
ncbi:Ribonuclease [Crateriforma conspicua]|uniref:Ribonuclease n=1 Tax=Crateriforma conspicua TaxID=2527996 RepID=A0A5C6FML5_9PLAN|nr:MBL fold metallo-hydrolase [Crateriforma conspicua]TWU63410.1 Ribonuclease [Crateriforma conspicua]